MSVSAFRQPPQCRYFSSQKPQQIIHDRLNEQELECAFAYSHEPVMVKEVLEAFNPEDSQVYLDMTFGAGGHTKELLKSAKGIQVYALDRDPVAFKKAEDLAISYSGQVRPILGCMSDLPRLLTEAGIERGTLDGILIDAGCSSMQFDDPHRGFALSMNGPLDMRMDGTRIADQPTAADVLESLDFESLAKIFKCYGEERCAKKIAQAVIDARYLFQPLTTTSELAALVASVMEKDGRLDRLQRKAHVATKIFMALRIFINNELNELNYGMEMARKYLKVGGRVVALTFHSLEDRIVKRHMMGIDLDEKISPTMSMKYKNAGAWHSQGVMDDVMNRPWEPIYKKVIFPNEEEVSRNPRSRSAKLRAARRK